MNPSTRACAAYVASQFISPFQKSTIYDQSRSKYLDFSGFWEGQKIDLYDHDRDCYFSGTLPELYDYGIDSPVRLEISGNQFSGYDYQNNQYFSGVVNGFEISLYDHGESKQFNYRL